MPDALPWNDPAQLSAMIVGFTPKLLSAVLILLLFWLLQRITRPTLRAILRRAERRAITAERASPQASAWIVPYLNRLADLLWVLARAAEQAAGAPVTTARVR